MWWINKVFFETQIQGPIKFLAAYKRGRSTNSCLKNICINLYIPGHPPELSDYVKLLLTNGSSHVFEIDLVLKSILWRFLYQNFIHFGQVVCLLYGFEVKADVLPLDKFFMKIKNPACLHFQYFLTKSFQRDKISLELKINLKKNT